MSLRFVVLLLAGWGLSASSACEVKTRQYTGQVLDGELLVLSTSSLAYRGHTVLQTGDPAPCETACSQLPGCNAWAYCSKPTGCGSGCKAFVRTNPKMTASGPGLADPASVISLPVRTFGPFSYPRHSDGCQFSPQAGTTSDAWPFAMCMLQRVRNVKQPQFVRQAAAAPSSGEGWVAGTLAPTPDCEGVPAAVCSRCGKTRDPERCLECARDKRTQYERPVQYLVSNGSLAQAGCATCTNLKGDSQQGRCFDAVLQASPASACVYGSQMFGFGSPNISACLGCTARKGSAFAGGCNACAQSRTPGRCFACLDTFPLKYCAQGQSPDGSGSGCRLLPNDQTPCDLCSNAALSDEAFTACLACSTNTVHQEECMACASTPRSAADQLRCYSCIGRAAFDSYSSYGCAACLNPSLVAAAQASTCLACVEDAATPMAAKSSCASCLDVSVTRTAAATSSCFGCLRVPGQEDYASACVAQTLQPKRRRA